MKQYHLPICGEAGYTNPLHFPTPGKVNPDPYVIEHCGRYYGYSSGHDGVNLSASDDLVHWQDLGFAIQEPEKLEYWAPCVLYDNGTFYLYYSNTNRAGNEDCHFEYLKVATSASPEGPFVYKKTFFEKFSIDAHVVRDADRTLYLFYSVNDWVGCDTERPGTVILVEEMTDPMTLSGNPLPVVIPSVDEEIFEENRLGDGRDWHTIEGAFYLEHCGNVYVMFSANCYQRENYFVGYSIAPKDGPIRALAFEKSRGAFACDPLIRRSERVEGTGHNSVVKAPNGFDDWVVYHGRFADEPLVMGMEQRQMRIDPLFFSGGRMVCNAPSNEWQTAPYFPFYHRQFANGQPVSDGMLTISEYQGMTGFRLKESIPYMQARIWISAKLTHSGARYGIDLNYVDESNYLRAVFDSGRSNVSLVRVQNGFTDVICTVRLPANYRHDVPHCVRVIKIGDHYEVSTDDIFLLETDATLPHGVIGVTGLHTVTALYSISVTKGVQLWGKHLRRLSSVFCADRPIPVKCGCIRSTSSHSVVLQRIDALFEHMRVTIGFESFGGIVEVHLGKIQVMIENMSCTVSVGDDILTQCTMKSRAFSLMLTRRGKQVWLLADDHPIVLPDIVGTPQLSLQLKNSAITEYTELALEDTFSHPATQKP